ncbi:hypothetical protein QUA13_22940 [Microcoleus sp. S28C3]|uniref:hypothetical protein n=1 Tax=Microcoleus sp. S28C3 TaxID=3055414 RepID=UPI002FD10E1F
MSKLLRVAGRTDFFCLVVFIPDRQVWRSSFTLLYCAKFRRETAKKPIDRS